MIYLKFTGMDTDNPPCTEVVRCTKSYTVAPVEGGIRIYFEPGWEMEEVSKDCWLNCYVMSETGKTIDVYHAG